MNQNVPPAAMKTRGEKGRSGIPEPENDGQSGTRRKLNFLMVDDDDICLFIHRRVLELSGYCKSAHSAGNGKTGLEILKIAADGGLPMPDIILLDLDMPVMNGLAFLEAFQHINCSGKDRISIVLLTSSVSAKDRNYALSLGVSQCLSKPFTSEALESIIHTFYNRTPQSPI